MWILRYLLVAPVVLPVVILAFIYYMLAWGISKLGKPGNQLADFMFKRGEYLWLFQFSDRLVYWAAGRSTTVKPFEI